MASRSSRPTDQQARPAGSSVSRRSALKRAAAAAVGGGATLLGAAAQAGQAAPAVQTGTQQGRKFRAFLRMANAPTVSVEEITMYALDENRVVVRTEATQCCYTITTQALGTGASPDNRILGHGGVGIVEAVGAKVRRVQVGDRVIVANTPYCGQCYMCLRGRPDRCQMLPGSGNPLVPIGRIACGLGTTFGIAPVEPGSDVCVLACGPLGLSAVQGA